MASSRRLQHRGGPVAARIKAARSAHRPTPVIEAKYRKQSSAALIKRALPGRLLCGGLRAPPLEANQRALLRGCAELFARLTQLQARAVSRAKRRRWRPPPGALRSSMRRRRRSGSGNVCDGRIGR